MSPPNEQHRDLDAVRRFHKWRLETLAHAPYWQEADEPVVRGVLVDVDTRTTKRGQPAFALTIKQDNPDTRAEHPYTDVYCARTALYQAVLRERPQPGERIAIRYNGFVEPDGGGNSFHSYTFVVDRGERPVNFDYDSLAAQEEAEAEPATAADPLKDEDDDLPF